MLVFKISAHIVAKCIEDQKKVHHLRLVRLE